MTPEQHLAWFFERSGKVRLQDAERFKAEGWQIYKKGFEIRLTVRSDEELAEIRRLLEQTGFKLARPFRHSRHRQIQPIYGKAEVARFLAFLPEDASASPKTEQDS